jgi:hypothetical protein
MQDREDHVDNGHRSNESPIEEREFDTVPVSPADIESAGRSCMAILVMIVVIVVILLLWVVVRSTGIGL